MDPYDELISKAKKRKVPHSSHGKKKLRRAISASRWKLILATLTVALLIVPTCYMLTFAYYAFGTKSTTLMDTASKVLYITEPNTTLEEMEFDMDFSLFSMDLSFDQFKQIGSEFYPSNHYDLHFVLDDLVNKEVTTHLDKMPPKYPTQTNQWLAHPAQSAVELGTQQDWEMLTGLPDETVVEAYLSFNELYNMPEVETGLSNLDIVWAAIYTGVEDEMLSADGNLVSPIGYPVQPDQTYWSPFRDSPSHEETFLQMLKEIEPYEQIATEVSSHKNLKLAERIKFIEQNGFSAYGVVATGPKQELEKLRDSTMIRYMKVGEVKLWNWTR